MFIRRKKRVLTIVGGVILAILAVVILRSFLHKRKETAAREAGIEYGRQQLIAYAQRLDSLAEKYPSPMKDKATSLSFVKDVTLLFREIDLQAKNFDMNYPNLVRQEREQTFKELQKEEQNAMRKIMHLSSIGKMIEKKYATDYDYIKLKKSLRSAGKEKSHPDR